MLVEPDQLAATTQPPSSSPAGTPFSVAVRAKDGLGNADTSFNGPVTVTDTDGYSVGRTLTINPVNGVATFSGLTLTQATSYNALSVSSGDLPSATTNGISVTGLAATHWVVIAPFSVAPGGPFSLTVNAEDQYGNVDPTFFGNVTISLAANPGGSTLGGSLTATAINGVATFSGLTVDQFGNSYYMSVSSPDCPRSRRTTSTWWAATAVRVAICMPPTSLESWPQ